MKNESGRGRAAGVLRRALAAAIVLMLVANAAVAVASAPNAGNNDDRGNEDARGKEDPAIAGSAARRVVMPSGMHELLASLHRKVPAFSRQTGLACSACHYQFPQLTPFGRSFKLNGYTLTGLKPITEPNAKKGAALSLLPIPPVAVMLMASGSHLGDARPGAQNDVAEMPQQLSLFLAGSLTPHIGALLQATYSGSGGSFGIDNSDVRYVTRARLADKDAIFGLTLHNNPTVQDVWNTTPAWGYPFISSNVPPGTIAAPVISGQLAQQVLGFGGYGLWNNLVYVEATAYRSALQGISPADSTAANTIQGVTPYWRLALEHQFGPTYGMIGVYGLVSHLYPTGVTGLTNRFTNAAVDAQLEHTFGAAGVVIGRATWINESQVLSPLFASGAASQVDNTLNTGQVNVSVEPNARYGVTLGYFSTTGTRDSLLYAPAPLVGSRVGSPQTNGFIEELDYNPWQNIRIGLQGVQYSKFNGAATNYDGAERAATGNNTVYVFAWVAF